MQDLLQINLTLPQVNQNQLNKHQRFSVSQTILYVWWRYLQSDNARNTYMIGDGSIVSIKYVEENAINHLISSELIIGYAIKNCFYIYLLFFKLINTKEN